MAGSEDADHFGLALRRHDQIAGHVIELPFEDRTIPIEIPAFLLDDGGIVFDLEPVEFPFEGGNIHHCTIRSSSSE